MAKKKPSKTKATRKKPKTQTAKAKVASANAEPTKDWATFRPGPDLPDMKKMIATGKYGTTMSKFLRHAVHSLVNSEESLTREQLETAATMRAALGGISFSQLFDRLVSDFRRGRQ